MAAACPACHDTGFEIRARPDGASVAVRCSCSLRERGDLLLRAARIPKRYAHCGLGPDSFEINQDPSLKVATELALDWIERWPEVEGRGLLFLGQPGTGKTHLVVGIARKLIENKGARVLFYEERQLFKEIQATFGAAAARAESDVLRPILDAEVLILDDLGAGRTTHWAREVLHDVITHRYNEELPLILTSNHPTGDETEGEQGRAEPGERDVPEERTTLRDRLGDSLMSRLYEICRVVVVKGKDYRRGVLHAKIHF